MNIFVLSDDPVQAAQDQCDKHVVKMIVESAQMLSTVHRMLDGTITQRLSNSGKRTLKYYELHDDREDILYKAVHHNHPCTVWSRENCCNYNWHYEHFTALCDEYTYRYGKIHATDTKLRTLLKELPKNILHTNCKSAFKLAMGSNPECVVVGLGGTDVVESYRNFYHTKQERFKMDWTKRNVPEWFTHASI
jgi:hypothetical protein|tara:strand:+ start:1081 stop:1656 length:576 start_codon:yes stop_codon:yes gene_type:complete